MIGQRHEEQDGEQRINIERIHEWLAMAYKDCMVEKVEGDGCIRSQEKSNMSVKRVKYLMVSYRNTCRLMHSAR